MSMTTPRIDSGKLGELAATPDGRGAETVFAVSDLSVLYSGNLALRGVTLDVRKNFVTAFIGPSGCGKNPFPKSIYDNIAFGPRILGMKNALDERVERSLKQAALWDEVKDRLKENALGLS